jgi:hypothetical protein
MGILPEPVTFEESCTPYPPPFRWFKRSLLIGAIILAMLISLRVWWGWYAHRQLEATIDAIRAAGEPIDVQDVKSPPVPDTDNAVWYYRQAFAAIKPSDAIDQATLDDFWSPSATGDLTTVLTDDQTALHFARLARQHDKINWNITWSGNLVYLLLPDVAPTRGLARILTLAAAQQHRHGNDSQAVQSLRDLHHLADAMNQFSPPLLVSHLVAIGIDAIESDAVNHLSWVLHPPGSQSAEGRQIADLIRDLLNEQQFQTGGIRCWFGERRLVLDNAPTWQPQMGIMGMFLHPMFELDEAHMLANLSIASGAIQQPNWPLARGMIGPRVSPQSQRGVFFVSHIFSELFSPSLNPAIEQHFRVLAERRAAVIALAIVLYRSDHGQQWPRTLDDLVPQYLPAVPQDPFAAQSTPFLYKRNAAGGPIIYSVGENGIDDGGSETPAGPRSGYSPDRWDDLDAVFHLTPQTAATAPAASNPDSGH